MVPVCDKRYHIYNRFRHFWAEIKKLGNYPLMGTDYVCNYYYTCIVAFLVNMVHIIFYESYGSPLLCSPLSPI